MKHHKSLTLYKSREKKHSFQNVFLPKNSTLFQIITLLYPKSKLMSANPNDHFYCAFAHGQTIACPHSYEFFPFWSCTCTQLSHTSLLLKYLLFLLPSLCKQISNLENIIILIPNFYWSKQKWSLFLLK